ncbi:MAG TPA: VOC family protein [bacterium]|nr:VOC family protein [bacterium]
MPETAAVLPASTAIGAVHLTVAALDRAVAFYQETIGFRLVGRFGPVAELSATGHPPVHLILTERPQARRGRTAGLYHFAILLPSRPDLGRALRHLVEAQAPLEGASDHAVSEALYLRDPEGNGIEIYADRPPAQWPRRGTELAMTTTALDLQGLLAEAGGAWSGLPDGTRIGHIHLHVADLRRSEAFYAGILGFTVTLRSYPGALFLAAGDYHHHLGLNTWAGTDLLAADPEGLGLRYFTLTLPDRASRDEVVDRLRRARVPVQEARHGSVAGWLTHDPDGIGVLLTT